jgi:hypothetical protein
VRPFIKREFKIPSCANWHQDCVYTNQFGLSRSSVKPPGLTHLLSIMMKGSLMATTTNTQQGSVMSGMLWMLGLALLLFWIPVVGPLIAGFVGGRKSGSVGSAIISSIIPAALASGLFLLIGAAFGVPIIGAIVGAGLFVVILVELVPMTIAAIVGGATA